MEDKDKGNIEPKQSTTYCISCGKLTNYICLQCSASVCNRCAIHEPDDECQGWLAGKAVGYCINCNIFGQEYEEKLENNKKSEQTNAGDSSTIPQNEDDGEENCTRFIGTKRKKGKAGRKAVWSTDAVDDLVDIITSDDYNKQKLIFTNTKIKIMALFMKSCHENKTATGIQRFQDEKGFGKWFDLLFPLVKTRDSCQPGMAVEPSALNDLSEEEEIAKTFDDFVPQKKIKLPKKNQVTEAVELLKQIG
ncbi:uncharacterized protein LOC114520140 [Dendronephthya gigantea]|uniref:uncharacterized protein LOC114520140 n=1 Tax=Dendronephthya gigantea TaxID=151771 RepID=UPI00106A1A5A|nr:uncharacterized protein LOC114520140 [Dendronephthya gigantea]